MPRCIDCRCWLGWLLAAAAAVGCSSNEKPVSTTSDAKPSAIQLKLLVVDDSRMAAAIDRLRAEWNARAGVTLSIEQKTDAELVAAETPCQGADAIIYPSGHLGLLVERGWIARLPAQYMNHRELAWSDTFELLQIAETRWGQIPYAVPFGSAVLTCYYRADLFEKFHKRPPQTWSEYRELAQFFARRENLGDAAPSEEIRWFGCIEPLAEGWAGRVLLARAAAYARHRDHYSTLFNIDTMEPLVATAPFVRALEELVADAELGPLNPLQTDLDAARREFLAGHAAMALSVPGHSAAGDLKADQAAAGPPTGFAELPGSQKVYNFAGGTWENRKSDESPHVPLLGFSGRLGSVVSESPHADGAFQLLAWLAGREWGATVGSASPATTLYRRSQVRSPQPWLDPLTDQQAARQYAGAVQDALGRQAYLSAPRIFGQEKYLAALDAAVQQAVSDQKSPQGALSEAAEQWKKITAEVGLDAQRKAYRQSLGLEP